MIRPLRALASAVTAALIAGTPAPAQTPTATPAPTSTPAAPIVARTPYKDGRDGPLKVARHADLTLRDASREKSLKVRVTYPETGGPCPVIIFSHGFGGSREVAGPLANFWASHGYIVIAPTHADSGLAGSLIGVRGRRGQSEVTRDHIANPEAWKNRVGDVAQIIDALSGLPARVPALADRIDATRIGIGGHSFGAFTTQLAAGMTLQTRDGEVSHPEKRASAYLVLSGQGRGRATSDDSFAAFTAPMLVMTGTRDVGLPGQDAQTKTDPHTFAPPGGKYLAVIDDAAHMTFTGRGLAMRRLEEEGRTDAIRRQERIRASAAANSRLAEGLLAPPSPNEAELFSVVQQASLAFWDAHLRGDEAARAWLASTSPRTCAGATLRWEWK